MLFSFNRFLLIHYGQQGDIGVSIARELLIQHKTSDNEAASDDEDQWDDPHPAIDDTQSEQPSQRITVTQQAVTRETKDQAREKKKELVNRDRQLAKVHAEQS